MRILCTASFGLALSVMVGMAACSRDLPLPAPPAPAGVVASPVAFTAIPGWRRDDHALAWGAWLASCRAQAEGHSPPRGGVPVPEALAAVCREALALGPQDDPSARRFFESRFVAWRIRPPSAGSPAGTGEAFYTGYYEPEVAGSLVRGGVYQTPILGRPADLVTFDQDAVPAGFEGCSAARRRPDGTLEVYPDRAAIEDGALEGEGLERAFVADPVDFFFMQVQGSGRLRLENGDVVRLAYAGRNGWPYTSIGKVAAARLGVSPAEMTMARLRAFLAEDPAVARRVMRENRSFVFFRTAPTLDAAAGPIGGEGLPLTPLRSIAVDRRIWPYGLPVFVDTAVPDPAAQRLNAIRRLMIAQDTGSAIVGAARADIFFGSGDAAGAVAGAVRHGGEFYVLWPRGPARSATGKA